MRPAQRAERGFQLDGTSPAGGRGRAPASVPDWDTRPSFSAHDSHGLGKKKIYFCPFMNRISNAETSSQMKNTLI